MRMFRTALLIAVALPAVGRAQADDSLRLGDRVRVRVAATHGNTNLFIGNVTSLAGDTLTLAMPGGKGTVILPRASITQVAVSAGLPSRWKALMPLTVPLAMLAYTSARSSHHGRLGGSEYAVIGFTGYTIGHMMFRPRDERWRPLYSWLDRP